MKICRKWFGVHFFEFIAGNSRSFQVKTHFFKDMGTLQEEAQTLAYGKTSKKTENLSKMVRGAHFETFYTCYLIFLGKDTFL